MVNTSYLDPTEGPSTAVVNAGGCASPLEGHELSGEPLDVALLRFKHNVQQEDIVKEIKRHSFYLKPGEQSRTEKQ